MRIYLLHWRAATMSYTAAAVISLDDMTLISRVRWHLKKTLRRRLQHAEDAAAAIIFGLFCRAAAVRAPLLMA